MNIPYINEPGYLQLLRDIKLHGNHRMDRTGVGCSSIFGVQVRYDIQNNRIPLLTSKQVHYKSVIKELLWFLRGETNINTLGCKIWDQWADENGDLGPIYGKQWRSWSGKSGTIDQIANVIKSLKDDPFSRRHIVSAWNPSDLDDMALVPCHCLFQFFVTEGPDGERYLSCQLYQRSADVPIGVPFNIASYSILTIMIANILGYKPLDFVHAIGDAHIYDNQLDGVNQQLDWVKDNNIYQFPTLSLKSRDSIDDFILEDFEVKGYQHGPFIPLPVAK